LSQKEHTIVANTAELQRRSVALWKGRPVIALNELFGRERLFQGLVIGRKGMSYQRALQQIDNVFREVVAADPEAWSYDDVIQRLLAAGFEQIQPAEWWEGHVELNDD
jgi:hypothetical protein